MSDATTGVRTKHHEQWIKEFHRYVGDQVARFLSKTEVTPTQLTIYRFFFAIVASALVALNWGHWSLIIAAIGFYLFSMIDAADGSLAKLQNSGTTVGAWLDRQADGLAFFLLFLALATRFAQSEAAGVSWSVATLSTLILAFLVKTMEIGLRNKPVLKQLSSIAETEGPPPEEKKMDLLTILKRQISPDFHTVSLILTLGLLFNELKVMVLLLLGLMSSWWIGRTLQVFFQAQKFDAAQRT